MCVFFCVTGAFWAVRALMVIGVLLSVLGAMMSLTSLVLGSLEDSTKARMCLTAGVAIIIGGRFMQNSKILQLPRCGVETAGSKQDGKLDI